MDSIPGPRYESTVGNTVSAVAVGQPDIDAAIVGDNMARSILPSPSKSAINHVPLTVAYPAQGWKVNHPVRDIPVGRPAVDATIVIDDMNHSDRASPEFS